MARYREQHRETDELTPLEVQARQLFDACRHDHDDFLSLRRRARFSREAAGVYRQWLECAARRSEAKAENSRSTAPQP